MAIGVHDSPPELGLEEPLSNQPRCVLAAERRVGSGRSTSVTDRPGLIELDRERQVPRIVAHDEDGKLRDVEAWVRSVEVHERRLRLHCAAETDVVAMVRVGPAIGVPKEVLPGGNTIRVLARDRRDGKGNPEPGWAEDPLRTQERDAHAVELEARCESRSRELAVGGTELRQPLEGRQPDAPLSIDHRRPGYGDRGAPCSSSGSATRSRAG